MKLYRKIDIYEKLPTGLRYVCSTNQARNCREARERFAMRETAYVTAEGRVYFPGAFRTEDLRAFYDKSAK